MLLVIPWRVVVSPVIPWLAVLKALWMLESELESALTLLDTVVSAVVIVPMLVVRMFRLLWIPARSVVIVANAEASLLVEVTVTAGRVVVIVVVLVTVVLVPVMPGDHVNVVVLVAVLP